MLAGVVISIVFWLRMARRDDRLILIYLYALAGAFMGAKLVYLASEGWLYWHDKNRWIILATGKSITGALLGGYLAVELAKKHLGYRGVTGDWFAAITPLTLMLGRVGCILQGCCLGRVCETSWYTTQDSSGVSRWPAAMVELFFNAIMLLVFFILRRFKKLPGQHFHIYMIAYGIFRFAHEFLRDTPQIAGPISGYQIAALLIALVGGVGYHQRQRATPLLKQPQA